MSGRSLSDIQTRAENRAYKTTHLMSYEFTATGEVIFRKINIKFFVCLHGDKTYNSFVCGNTT
jgi:hypothetical protein